MNEDDRLWSERNIEHHPEVGSFVRAWLNKEKIGTRAHCFLQPHLILDASGLATSI